jgi:hypothetical protein
MVTDEELQDFTDRLLPIFQPPMVDLERESILTGFERHLKFVEWVTLLGIAVLTIALPIVFTSKSIAESAGWIKFLLFAGSLFLVVSSGLGIAFVYQFHDTITPGMSEKYLSILKEQQARMKSDIRGAVPELTEKTENLFGIVIREVTKEVEKELEVLKGLYRPQFILQFTFFCIGVGLTVTPLICRFAQVFFGSQPLRF